MTSPTKISIIGAGSWGSALALLLAKVGHEIILWGHNPSHIENLQKSREAAPYLPGIFLPENIHATTDLAQAAEADIIFFVVPSKFVRDVATSLRELIKPAAHPIIVSCTKGIEYASEPVFKVAATDEGQGASGAQRRSVLKVLERASTGATQPVAAAVDCEDRFSGKLMSEVIAEIIPTATLAVLSGPNLAGDIARGLPAAGVLGCTDKTRLSSLQTIFHNTTYRAYTSDDLRGIQLGGALKNIFAIATGVSDGLGMGENARAGLVTRALAEMTRLGVAMGGAHKTFFGLSGIGDLMATCTSRQSRNYQAGLQLCSGKSPVEIQNTMTMIAEGFFTARSAQQCARHLHVETPIIDEVVAVLDHGKTPMAAMKQLLGRRMRSEEA